MATAKRKIDVLVIGAGFAGATLARAMADAGKKVLLLEKRSHIGGNMYDENRKGIFVHQYGPHIFHTSNRDVFEFLKRFSEWNTYKHSVLGKINGKLAPIPFNFTSIDLLFSESSAATIKAKLSECFGMDKTVSIFDLLNHPDKEINEFGRFVYDKVFVNYTAKQWGTSIDNIDISTINRVPVVIGYGNSYFSDPIQAMPKNGFTSMFTEMLHSKNITVQLNTDAKERIRFDFETKKVYFDNEEYKGILFFTGAIDAFLDYKYGQLPYRSLNLVFENIDKEWYQPNSVVNYPNEEEWTRITEFKHFYPPSPVCEKNVTEKKHETIILKEYPLPYEPGKMQEPYYPIINENNAAVYNHYVHALSSFDNVYLCGRLAEYKYYNMDAVVARALELAKSIIAKSPVKKPVFNQRRLLKEVILYGMIGLCCAGLDSLLFLFLRKLGVNLYVSNFIGINLGILSSFLLNAFFNFKTKDKLKLRALKFFSVGYCGLALSMLVMFVGVDIFQFKDVAVKIFSVFVVAAFQFILNKSFTFKTTRNG
jgi:UDP-galactopyranose mutase